MPKKPKVAKKVAEPKCDVCADTMKLKSIIPAARPSRSSRPSNASAAATAARSRTWASWRQRKPCGSPPSRYSARLRVPGQPAVVNCNLSRSAANFPLCRMQRIVRVIAPRPRFSSVTSI